MRRLAAADRARLWTLIAAGLLSHLLLDAGNSYGVHPFFPFDSRWYYGDAVFIFEPWLWLLLGVPVRAWMASRPATRLALLALLAVLPVGLARAGVVPAAAVAALVATGLVFGWGLSRLPPRGRALTAIAASVVVRGRACSASRASARGDATTLLAPAVRGEILDVVLTPDPASPVCWSVIVVERDDGGGRVRAAPGDSVPPPRLAPAHRLRVPPLWRPAPVPRGREGGSRRYDEIRQPLGGAARPRASETAG